MEHRIASGIQAIPVNSGDLDKLQVKTAQEIGEIRARMFLFEEWLSGSGESTDERPWMELYRRTQQDTSREQVVTGLSVAFLRGEGRLTAAGGLDRRDGRRDC